MNKSAKTPGTHRASPKEVLRRRAKALLDKIEAAGHGDHPLADLVRAEVASPTPNVATWDPVTGFTLGWHIDEPPAR